MARNIPQIRKQGGAALVVGLLLLLILTMLAISSMNSASVEFVMAGNEQYHQNAFQAAEAGIAQTMATVDFNSNDLAVHNLPGTVPGSTTDSYSANYSTQLNGKGLSAAIWTGISLDTFSSYHFEIQSTGSSARNGTATNIQGVVKIAKSDSSFQNDPTLGASALQ